MNGYQQVLAAVAEHGDNLEAYKTLGDISVKQFGTLLLFSYRTGVTAWNEAERVSRGLIVDFETCRLVAVPFEKFFNLGERPETQLDALPNEPFEVTAKLDGSLGILYQHRGAWAIATRGSFTSEQAIMASHMTASYTFAWVPPHLTLLFEIIYPENRIVCNYGKDAMLTLIGARSFNQHGVDFDCTYEELRSIADRCNCPLVESFSFSHPSQLMDRIQSAKGIEGWVLRYPGGFRVKIKTAEYVRLHRLITGFSPKRIHECLLDGTYDMYTAALPDQLQDEARYYAKAILDYVNHRHAALQTIMHNIRPLAESSRGHFALTVKALYPDDAPYFFALLDGKDIYPMLLKNAPLTPLNTLFAEQNRGALREGLLLREDLLW